ncbi:MAG TPA: biosynthetic peptidoglycan transglycosylase [Nannocystaceae bacterium]|nr:biosynthetic peptidoglycan transglycosylase [Nannocystaceae bacterium]
MFRRVAIGLGIVVLALVADLGVLFALTPNVSHLRDAQPTQTSFMRVRAAERTRAGADRVEWIDLGQVSPYLVCAIIKAEDRGFFRHSGFEWAQLRKALWGHVTGGSGIGGSTITQQLARNLYLSPARTLHRKLREALITRRLESSLDKRRILELYLNVVEWGDGVWGVAQAARAYFGRSPAELGLFEAAFLASLLPAPRARLRGTNLDRAVTEQRRVLHQLVVSGLVDRAAFSDARARVALLVSSLSRGEPLAQAVQAATTPATRARPLELAEVLANECGFVHELTAATRARRAVKQR